MKVDLSRVKERETLPVRREPHWQRIRPGCFLGYRPSSRGGAGTWIARGYDEETRGYKLKALGDFGNRPPNERFATAKKEAEGFAEIVESGGHSAIEVDTVEDACRAYAKRKPEAEGRFKRHVYLDAIGKVKLTKLRRRHLREWRERLEQTGLSPSSINREMVPLRAALNALLAAGPPNTEADWQEPLRPIQNADRQRTLRLDRKQRRALLDAIDAEAAPFVTALCLVPLRPGALANLNAADFDKRTRELTVGRDKNGKPRRIVLPTNAAALFAKATKDKLPSAPMFARANGGRWYKERWRHPISDAARAARLPMGTCAYTLRHSVISELVEAGLPILTVAQISGTSVQMIERHYGHLNAAAAVDALAGLAL